MFTGESKFMGTNQDCPATAAKAVSGAVNTMTDKIPTTLQTMQLNLLQVLLRVKLV